MNAPAQITPPYKHTPLFPLGKDTTRYRKLTDLAGFNTMAKSTPIVDKTTATDYNPDVINKLHTIINIIEGVGAAIALILLVISVVIIMNTIRTAVYARRTEIEIMKLVGATDWFVRWPFILEGMLGGLLAAIFSGAIVYFGATSYCALACVVVRLVTSSCLEMPMTQKKSLPFTNA